MQFLARSKRAAWQCFTRWFCAAASSDREILCRAVQGVTALKSKEALLESALRAVRCGLPKTQRPLRTERQQLGELLGICRHGSKAT